MSYINIDIPELLPSILCLDWFQYWFPYWQTLIVVRCFTVYIPSYGELLKKDIKGIVSRHKQWLLLNLYLVYGLTLW